MVADSALCFEEADFGELPAEGYYLAAIERAGLRISRQGNATVQVVCEIAEAPVGQRTVVDYFVVSGASERARAVGRRRPLELYRACGFQPKSGYPIRPQDLAGCRLQVRVGHEIYEGTRRLKVLAYRGLP